MIAVVILLQVWFQRDLLSWWLTQVIKCKTFYHSAIGKGLRIESIRKLGNFDFQWTKTLNQNNSSHIALFFTLFKGYKYNYLFVVTAKTISYGSSTGLVKTQVKFVGKISFCEI